MTFPKTEFKGTIRNTLYNLCISLTLPIVLLRFFLSTKGQFVIHCITCVNPSLSPLFCEDLFFKQVELSLPV